MLVGDILDVFRKGKKVADPALWKSVGATSALIAGVVTSGLSVAAAFGYHLDLGEDIIQALAMGVAGVLYFFTGSLHITTSERVGLPARPDSASGGNILTGGEG